MNAVAQILMTSALLIPNGEFVKRTAEIVGHNPCDQPAFFSRLRRLSESNGELLKINARTAQIAERSQQLQVELAERDTKLSEQSQELAQKTNELAQTKAQLAAAQHMNQTQKGDMQKFMGIAGVLGMACVACLVKSRINSSTGRRSGRRCI